MSVLRPTIVWQAALLAATATTQSGSLTVTVNLTNGWEISIPIVMGWRSGASADGVVNAFQSNDGGATYDTSPIFSIALPRVIAGGPRTSQATMRLPSGQYALQILNSGPSTGTASVGTQMVMDSITNT